MSPSLPPSLNLDRILTERTLSAAAVHHFGFLSVGSGTSGTVTDPQMCNVSAMPARTESDTRDEQRRDDEHADEIATGEKGGMDSARRGQKIGND